MSFSFFARLDRPLDRKRLTSPEIRRAASRDHMLVAGGLDAAGRDIAAMAAAIRGLPPEVTATASLVANLLSGVDEAARHLEYGAMPRDIPPDPGSLRFRLLAPITLSMVLDATRFQARDTDRAEAVRRIRDAREDMFLLCHRAAHLPHAAIAEELARLARIVSDSTETMLPLAA